MSTLVTVSDTAARDALSPAVGDAVYQIDNKKINVCSSLGPVVWQTYSSVGVAHLDTDITALSPHMWMDSGDPNAFFTDSGKGTAVTGDGDLVGCWADRSGNGFDWLQTASTKQPNVIKNTGLNNRTGLIFSTDQLEFLGTASSEIASENMVLVMALRMGLSQDYLWNQTGSTNRIRTVGPQAGTGLLMIQCLPFGGPSGAPTFNTSYEARFGHDVNILVIRTNSGANTTEIFLDGGSAIGSTTAPTSAGRFFEEGVTAQVLNSQVEAPWWMFDMMVFDSSLSDADLDTVISYLGLKHGIAVTAVS